MNMRIRPVRRLVPIGLLSLISGLVAGCSRDNPERPPGTPAEGPERTSAEAASACAKLATDKHDDVTITEAVEQPFSERQTSIPVTQTVRLEVPNCKVAGVIDGAIKFELLMPDAWNGKLIMGGGGGFVGSVQNQAQDGLSAGATPLERGYATVGTDTGHAADGLDASWALGNAEAKENFGHRAVHRTAEVAKKIIDDYYDKKVDRSYFVGCSRGGGQGMIAAQRYPEDFDGIVAGAPVLDWPGTAAGFIRNQQVVFPDPSDLASPVITADNRKLVGESFRDACDSLDGVGDGLVTDPRHCKFDPASLPRCPAEPAAACLTEPQVEAIQTIYRGPIGGGQRLHPGFPFGGEADPGGWDLWITQLQGGGLPPGVPNLHYAFGTQFAKYFVYDDPNWTYANYDFATWRERSAAAAQLLNATNPDLSKFHEAGGKLIVWHGWSDSALTALSSIDYYDSVARQDKMARDYFRMFLMPGVGHCGGGPGPDRADWITAIEQWVEQDIAPEAVVATKADDQGKAVMERPLCSYPQAAQYDDSGDKNAAASFSCGVSSTAAN
jgi:tannase/feruloyl esterase